MPDYTNSFIYKLCCKDANIKEMYIGSTTNFNQRKYRHKINSTKKKVKVYNFINENGGFENWDMILIKKVSVQSRMELNKYERESIDLYKPSLNTNTAWETHEGRAKHKYENQKKKYQENPEMRKFHNRFSKIKVKCECGSEVQKHALSRHRKSDKHKKYMKVIPP